MKGAALAACVAVACLMASPARAADRDPDVDRRWGLSIWGVSYHVNRSIDYSEGNYGVGLRYYLNHYIFFEGDVLRNSNRGVVLPASAGVEIGIGTIFHACKVSAVGAATLAYYQNVRTDSDYFKFGPVPGAAFGCGRVKTNVLGILRPSREPLAAIAASVTIML